MKICYIADAESVHTQRWVAYFADDGHEVHLISPTSLGKGNIGDAKLHVLRKVCPRIRIVSYVINLLPYVIQIRRLLEMVKPDILHAHFVTGCGLWGALTGFHPLVLSAWGSDVLIAPKKSRIVRLMVRFVLGRADVIHCDADHMIAPLIELGAKREKIRLMEYGVDTQKFEPMERNENLRRELGISDSPTVISLRSLEPIYDIETLINSIPLVLKEIPEVKVLVIGKGSQEAKLKEQTESLGISPSVKFMGWIPNDELPDYLNSADIYVSTALSDGGLAFSTLEAMACGLPVIITDFGDNKRWVDDGTNGFLMPARNPQALASKIIHLIRNEEIRDKFGQINRRIIQERNDWRKEMRRMEEFYESLLTRSKK